MAVSYELDLNLPTDPGLPPGPEYDEFRAVYSALRQLQDGISLASGLVVYDQESLQSLAPLATYTVGSQTILIFEATTAITVGELVQAEPVGGVLKVKQPLTLVADATYFAWDRYVGMPLFACSAGQHVAIATRYGVAPKPGALCGYGYDLNTSLAVVQTTTGVPGYYYVGDGGGEAVIFTVGYCIEDNKLILNLTGGYYT